ncbi:MAG: TonB-dependent receptor, partial [Prevotella sp.]|nr:TonB-dependent receptor [Prevotella sp.]
MMKRIIFSYLILLVSLTLSAQTGNPFYDHIIHQANVFPQEKTYVCTDASCYQAGQRVSLRVFVVNAISHQPTDMSQYVYVELLNPERVVIKRIRLLQDQQTFTGYID